MAEWAKGPTLKSITLAKPFKALIWQEFIILNKTRVGWWKNGYPEYFAKVLNSVSWNQIRVIVDGVELDLNKYEPIDFERTLDMKNGLLKESIFGYYAIRS